VLLLKNQWPNTFASEYNFCGLWCKNGRLAKRGVWIPANHFFRLLV